MKKAILVLDMPDSCRECPLFGSRYTDMCCGGMNNKTIDYPYPKDFRQDWCPLKAVPEIELRKVSYQADYPSYSEGFYACLDSILE